MRLGGGGGGVRGVGHPGAGGQHEAGQGRLPGAGRVGGEARPHHEGARARGLPRLTVEAGDRESGTRHCEHGGHETGLCVSSNAELHCY